jgi:hypothetical protein
MEFSFFSLSVIKSSVKRKYLIESEVLTEVNIKVGCDTK